MNANQNFENHEKVLVELVKNIAKNKSTVQYLVKIFQESQTAQKKVLELIDKNDQFAFAQLEKIAMIIDPKYVKNVNGRVKNNELTFFQEELTELFNIMFYDNEKVTNLLIDNLIKLKKRDYYLKLFSEQFDLLVPSKLYKIIDILEKN